MTFCSFWLERREKNNHETLRSKTGSFDLALIEAGRNLEHLAKISGCGLGHGAGVVLENVGDHEIDERVASVDADWFEVHEA